MSIDKSEQWLLDGKCIMCRKKNYCSKPCRACKDRRNYEMCCAVSRVLHKTMAEGKHE